MIEKCAEAAALRRAFPEELGDEYAAEEAGAFRGPENAKDVTPPRPTQADFAQEPAREPTAEEEAEADRMAERFAQTGDAETIDDETGEVTEDAAQGDVDAAAADAALAESYDEAEVAKADVMTAHLQNAATQAGATPQTIIDLKGVYAEQIAGLHPDLQAKVRGLATRLEAELSRGAGRRAR
jgi:hypothetical protein